MCGIAGFCNLRDRDKQRNIAAMLDRIVHRGPDSSGTFYSENGLVTFGHRRLSIIDVTETGSQPMTSHNGRYVLTYNGEIYNHQELKKRLIEDPGSGVSASDFRGSSDSEILLEAISSYGIKDTLTFCKGMFAFAVYDKEEDTVILARDRMGEKPLYYGKAGGAFAFASDISSLKAIEGFGNEINRSVLPMYFMNGYISAPYTIFKDIFKLEPGCMLTIKAPFDLRDAVITTYYDLKDAAIRGISNPFNGSFTEAADELERLLKSSVKGQMISDVPLGAFLSSGTDSSTVVSIMQSISDQTVRSFTIGMSDPKYNEAEAASAIASHLGTEHTELYITEDDAKKVIPDIPRMFTEPFADSSQIPTYLVSKMTREHVIVSLSGDGGDELFNGYDRYPVFKGSWDRIRKYPYPVRSILGDLLANNTYDPSSDKYVRGRMLKAKGAGDLYNISRELDGGALNIVADDKRALNNNDTLDPRFLKNSYRQLMLMDMMMYLPDDILVKVDRCSMAVSLESRVPMLDRDVVEFALSLPMDYLYDENTKTGKKLLREVLYRYVPRELTDRPKKGFSIPISKWLREDEALNKWAVELLDPEVIAKQGFLNAQTVSRLWDDLIKNNVWKVQIWYILMFQSWLRQNGY